MLTTTGLRKVYRETVEEIYSFVSHHSGGDRELTEDVIQETYLRALGSWRRRGVPRQPIAWLKTTARNLLVSHYRKCRPVLVDDVEALAERGPLQSPEEAAALHWALGRLKGEQARIVEEFHFEGKRVKEIALDLGLSERAVEGRLRRARLALQAELRTLGPQRG